MHSLRQLSDLELALGIACWLHRQYDAAGITGGRSRESRILDGVLFLLELSVQLFPMEEYSKEQVLSEAQRRVSLGRSVQLDLFSGIRIVSNEHLASHLLVYLQSHYASLPGAYVYAPRLVSLMLSLVSPRLASGLHDLEEILREAKLRIQIRYEREHQEFLWRSAL